MLWRILNFVVFVGSLYWFLRKPAAQFWRERSAKIHTEIDEARKLREDEERGYQALSRRVAGMEKEVSELLASFKEEGEMEKSRLVSEAGRLAERLKGDGVRIREQEIRKAKTLLKMEAVKLSIEMAEKLIREKIGSEDQKVIADDYLKRLEGSA